MLLFWTIRSIHSWFEKHLHFKRYLFVQTFNICSICNWLIIHFTLSNNVIVFTAVEPHNRFICILIIRIDTEDTWRVRSIFIPPPMRQKYKKPFKCTCTSLWFQVRTFQSKHANYVTEMPKRKFNYSFSFKKNTF